MSKDVLSRKLSIGIWAAGAALAIVPAAAGAATITVNTTSDEFNTGASCSLREAVQSSNTSTAFGGCATAGVGGASDTIMLQSGSTYDLTISPTPGEDSNTEGDLDLFNFEDLVVTTDGAARATIDANGDGVGDPATTNERIMSLGPAATGAGNVTLDNLVITDGSTGAAASTGGAILAQQAASLTITESRITANRTTEAAGAILTTAPTTIADSTIDGNTAATIGAIWIDGGVPVDISGSTISNNSATGNSVAALGNAGAIYIASSPNTTLKNTTVSGNSANGAGGGIQLVGNLTLANATITNNTADSDAGGMWPGDGGGVFNAGGTLTARNSVIAGNFDNGSPFHNDCSGTITSQLGNLVGSATGCSGVDAMNDTEGHSSIAVLGALAANGGPTNTHRLVNGSAAINPVWQNPGALQPCESVDQRGQPRGGAAGVCDIGAYERQPPALDPVGSKTVQAGQNLTFTLSATDPDPDLFAFSGSMLPGGATVNAMSGVFSWTPSAAQVGTHPNVGLAVSDGVFTDNEAITITVTPAPPPPTGGGGGSTPTVSPPPSAATGQRAAALKKCKKKRGRARANCIKRAKKLPV